MPREFDIGDGSPPKRGEVENLRGGQTKTVAFILGPLLGACVLVGGIIWAMARYPDRPEFEDAKREMRAALSEYNKRLGGIEKDTAVTTVKVDAIQQSQARIESKLDKRR